MSGLEFDPKKAKEKLQSVEQARSDYYNWLEQLQAILDETRHDDPERRIVFIIDDLEMRFKNINYKLYKLKYNQ